MGAQGPFTPRVAAPDPIDPGIRLGHVHLRTADIDRIRGFYVDVLGFDVIFEARIMGRPPKKAGSRGGGRGHIAGAPPDPSPIPPLLASGIVRCPARSTT